MKSRKGQTLVEYVLILILAVIVVVGVLSTLGLHVEDMFTRLKDMLP